MIKFGPDKLTIGKLTFRAKKQLPIEAQPATPSIPSKGMGKMIVENIKANMEVIYANPDPTEALMLEAGGKIGLYGGSSYFIPVGKEIILGNILGDNVRLKPSLEETTDLRKPIDFKKSPRQIEIENA